MSTNLGSRSDLPSISARFGARLLLHLFTRQHLLMRSCRSVAAVTQPEGAGMAVSLQSLTADGKLSFKETAS